jgi:hypothetical protein
VRGGLGQRVLRRDRGGLGQRVLPVRAVLLRRGARVVLLHRAPPLLALVVVCTPFWQGCQGRRAPCAGAAGVARRPLTVCSLSSECILPHECLLPRGPPRQELPFVLLHFAARELVAHPCKRRRPRDPWGRESEESVLKEKKTRARAMIEPVSLRK